MLAEGGQIVGVMLEGLVEREAAHRGLKTLLIAATPHERRRLMHDLAEAYISLPGGLGTLEEFAETLCWRHLELHCKPHWLLNLDGYYDDLLRFMETGRKRGFMHRTDKDFLQIATWPEEIAKEPFEIGDEVIAFIRDPDGYLIELNQQRRTSY